MVSRSGRPTPPYIPGSDIARRSRPEYQRSTEQNGPAESCP
jgi:hypothetical protein